MIRLALISLLTATFAGSAAAQTSAQWSQLLGYVSQQTRLIIDLRTRMERMEASDAQQRAAINVAIAALDQERCRVSRLVVAVRDFTEQGLKPTWAEGVACIDLKSPVPPFPTPLSAPQ